RGCGTRDTRQQRAFAGIRQADQADVGNEFQLQPQPALFARLTGVELARRLMGARGEARIPAATLTAARDPHAVAIQLQVAQQRAGITVIYEGPGRDADDFIFAVSPAAVAALTGAAVLRRPVVMAGEIDKCGHLGIGQQIHAAAVAAVAAVGPAFGDIFLAPKADTAVAAATGSNADNCFVNKLHLYNDSPDRAGRALDGRVTSRGLQPARFLIRAAPNITVQPRATTSRIRKPQA